MYYSDCKAVNSDDRDQSFDCSNAIERMKMIEDLRITSASVISESRRIIAHSRRLHRPAMTAGK
jgi:hypothetical protein